jgi:phosphoribosylamine--glycine ligase
MKILLLGSGGREHAMAWKIAQSPLCEKLFIAPGNPGTALEGTNVPIPVNDFDAQADFCRNNDIGLVVVGPEDPLVNGVVDYFQQHLPNIPVIGPPAAGARLEGSKAFAKEFMLRHDIPTAAYRAFTTAEKQAGLDYLAQHSLPVVLKADGLAAGKGVLICHTLEEALDGFSAMLDGLFGSAGSKVVVEQFLTGIELTVIVLTDGKSWKILPPSKDYKRIGEGDTGLNTGGMGAVSPPPFATPDFMQRVEQEVIRPTIWGLAAERIPYKGFLYFGIIKVGDAPYVIEYNSRMGDPETQVIMPRIFSDIVPLYLAIARGELASEEFETDPRAAATVVLASHGYPGSFEKGKVITGLEHLENCIVFHAGTARNEAGELLSNGGRILTLTSYGSNLPEALQGCYANTARIYYDNRYFRRDIGFDVV